jgi:hypothetical protein
MIAREIFRRASVPVREFTDNEIRALLDGYGVACRTTEMTYDQKINAIALIEYAEERADRLRRI